MNRVTRTIAVASTAMLAVVGLTGCRTSPGAAALVGGFRISTTALQTAVNRDLADPGVAHGYAAKSGLHGTALRVALTRAELSRLITNHLWADAAAQRHVRVSASEVDQQISQFAQQTGGVQTLYAQAGQAGIAKAEFRSVVYYYVLEQKVGDALVAHIPVSQAELAAAYQQNIDQFEQVHIAHIQVASKKLADSILAQVRRRPSRFAALAAKYSADTSTKAKGGDLGFAGRGAFAQVKTLGDAAFAAKPGSFVEVQTQLGWHVVHVIAHRKVPLAQAAPGLKSQILQNQRTRLLDRTQLAIARRLGVHVNPRYGRWDTQRQQVVPGGASTGVSSPAPAFG
ncbi:MAG: peptidylprolyl isomerase [Frankiales bacterium]|nr:peptidylprolyl isomerase [Frankiales bacterium]